MKATIEFELPANQDAYLDAISGTRWRETIRSFEWFLIVSRETEENPERRKAFDIVLRQLRDDRQEAGLTYATVNSLRQDRVRLEKFRSKYLDEYLSKQGIPEMMAELRKENPPQDRPKARRQKVKKGGAKQGEQPGTQPPAQG